MIFQGFLSQTADQAQIAEIVKLGISLLALVISFFALGWNVYRDVILKPRMKITFCVRRIHQGGNASEPFIELSGVNRGPGPITGSLPAVKIRWWTARKIGKDQQATVLPKWDHEACDHPSKRLEVSEVIRFALPFEADCFLKERPLRVGITDSFGRVHWASRKSMKRVLAQYHKKFGRPSKQNFAPAESIF